MGGIVYYWMEDFYLEQSKAAMLQDIQLISIKLEENKDYDSLVKKIKKTLGARVTLIDADGKILAESDKDKSTMDNHRYRPEVMQSDKEAYGTIIRHSQTVDKKLLYVVKKYTINGHTLYVRLADELHSVNEHLLSLGIKIFVVLLLFFGAVFYFTYKIYEEVQNEMGKIIEFLTSLVKQKKLTYIRSNYSEEFAHITKLLTKVSQILTKKEKKKSKFTKSLQAANKQKDDIISAISHEFKNPIAVINGYSQTLLEDADINKNIRQKFLLKINQNGLKLNDLIDTLRLSIKLDNKQQTLSFAQENIYELVRDAAETLKVNYPNREVHVEKLADVTVKVDKALFGVMISNLIENALKYSEDNVVVTITKEKISVIDSGIGIAKKDLQNITEKFYRVQHNVWNNSLGLGLFLVNNIATLHHFTLKIESEPNEGSTFSVHF